MTILGLVCLSIVSCSAPQSSWPDLYSSGIAARGQARFQEARPYLEEALAAARNDAGASDADRAEMTDALGIVCQGLGDLTAAERFLLEARALSETHPQSNSALRAFILGDLGSLRLFQGRLPEAEGLLRQ